MIKNDMHANVFIYRQMKCEILNGIPPPTSTTTNTTTTTTIKVIISVVIDKQQLRS